MYKKLLLLLVLISVTINAQDTIKGVMKPAKDFSWVILYKLQGANQSYVDNATVKNGKFTLVMPKNAEPGMYRILYDNDKNLYIEVLYNKENLEFEFHPDYPVDVVKYTTSTENILFQDYIDKIAPHYIKLDSLQVAFFKTKDKNGLKKLQKLYKSNLIINTKVQKEYEEKSKDKLANTFIKANKRHYNNVLIENTDDYLKVLKLHYFDNIDFENPVLTKSSVIIERVIDYVMYLNTSKNIDTLTQLRKDAATFSLSKIKNQKLNKDVTESLLFLFGQQQQKEVVDYIFAEHYNKLPVALRDFEFAQMINDLFKTTIGEKAPDIQWNDFEKSYNLYNLEKSEYYVILFWSSTCPHCLKELPRFNKFLNDKKNIKTLAIGLESEDSKANWKEETFLYENLTHILGLGKWKSQYSQDYGVTGTPSYFVLDSDKKIIAKPYDFEKLEAFFKKSE